MGIIKKIKAVDATKPQQKLLHATIKKVTEDIESFSFNTAISQMMIFVNAFTNAETIPVAAMQPFLILLNPFAPHISSELWERLSAIRRRARRCYPTTMAGLRRAFACRR